MLQTPACDFPPAANYPLHRGLLVADGQESLLDELLSLLRAFGPQTVPCASGLFVLDIMEAFGSSVSNLLAFNAFV